MECQATRATPTTENAKGGGGGAAGQLRRQKAPHINGRYA